MAGSFLILFGMLSFRDLSFVRIAKKVYPGIAIRTEAQGFDASKIEDDITTPIERVIAQVGGVRKMTSVSEDGTSLIQVQLEEGVDLKFKSLEFREKIDTILSLFPREVHKPQVYRYDPSNSPLMVVSFSKENVNEDELREIVEKSFKKSLESIDGVSQVIVAGGKIREILISCDAKQMEAYSLSLRDIVNKFQDINQNDSLGKIIEINDSLALQVREKLSQMVRIKDIPLKVDEKGRPIYLKDLATVSYAPRDDHIGARLNAKEKVSAFIYKNDNSDATFIANQVRLVLQSKNQAKILVEYNQDESLIIRETIFSLVRLTLISYFLLFVYFFRNKSLPLFFVTFLFSFVSILLCFAFIYRILKEPVSLSGIYGLLLASILWFLLRIREVSFRDHQLKFQERTAFRNLVLGIFLCLLFTFLFPYTVFLFFANLAFPLLFGFILLDFYFPILFANVTSKIQIPIPETPYGKEKWMYLSGLILAKGKQIFTKTKTSILSHKLLFPVSVLFLSTLSVYTVLHHDFYDNIQSDERETVAILEFPSGTSFDHTSKVTLDVEKKLLAFSGVKQVVSKIDPAHSLLLITLQDGIFPDRQFLQDLKSGVGSTDDAFLFFLSDTDSAYFQEIVFDLVGYDQKELEELTQKITEAVKNLDGVNEAVLRYKQSREELELLPKQESFMISSMTLPLFGDELRLALQGGVATKFIDREKEIDIRVRYSEKYRNSKNEFNNIRIKNIRNKFVPISELVETKQDKIPLKYYHKNRSRVLSFAVKLEGNSTRLRNEVIMFVKSTALPEGYHIEVEDANEGTNNVSIAILFILYPIFFFLFVSLIEERKLRFLHLMLVYVLPYYFTFFLLQYIFLGPFSLPFQIGMLLSLPICFLLFHFRLGKAVYTNYFFCLTYVLFLIFLDTTVMSFMHIWASLTIYFLMISAAHFLKGTWERQYEDSLENFLWESVLKVKRYVNERRIFLKKKG
ncbi:RND transporter, Hydrophobe/Amphiphile Efflux-1 (HAE1)/Heavy Metal Efflux (HME) family, permease protein [Leptospira ryugenii]|uniref:RND transporter, Hydrophobe/Amphiphile Efflux-1 (HAE1)/Heavy Metal Efflux (HME) family, permease protein n=2 Tax=Leptospira ryugenii TaxID=1917863 RepID=A0A2P2E5E6_9LEPT|nr:RND transporter, Hydrophobe/Amphiphile Efflux-1 (HAE1)/Heavy Metal Efflux (HME) family, permease protein [Leptospira ryugenii]